MKVLTVLVPTYNVEKYLRRCLDSLLLPEVLEEIEVLVVNDGSKDGSADIARAYEKKYPQTVVFVDKENGGHGSTINVGIEKAQGTYFKVLDSDDWVNIGDFIEFVKRLKEETADAVICDYRKEHVYNGKSEYFEYKDLEDGKKYNLNEIDLNILHGEYFMMATTTYRTEVLRASGLKMLEKTFYVDMQYNIVPITKVDTFAYYHLDIYRYFIGRKDQSMNMDNFVRNQEHHKRMIKYDKDHKRAYNEIREFDAYLKKTNQRLYDRLNCMAYVRYNRETQFKFVKVDGSKWHKVMVLARKVKGRFAR